MSGRSRNKGKGDPVVPGAIFAQLGKLASGHAPGKAIGFASKDGITPPQQPPAAAPPAVEERPATPPPAQPSRAAAAPPPAAAAAAGDPLPPGEQWAASRDVRAESVNDWQSTLEQRDAWNRRRLNQELPQGETQLVHWWASQLARGVPANACTIWLTRTEPSPQYQIMIPGEAVASEQPDRALFLYVSRNRRQAGVAETFHGRIRAPLVSGKIMELGGGVLHLPPDKELQQQPGAPAGPWQTPPGASWTPGTPWPGSPYGAPPYGWGAPPWAQPGGTTPPWWGQSWPWGQQQQQPWGQQSGNPMAITPELIAALKDKPDLLPLWNVMAQTLSQSNQPPAWQQTMMEMMMRRAMEPPKQNGIGEMAAWADFIDKIRGPQKQEGSGLTVTYVEDGAGGRMPIVAKNGEVDTTMTLGVPAVGAMRSVVSAVKSRMTGTAPGMARGHAPAPAAQMNGTNGAKH